MRLFIIYPADRGFAIQREDGLIVSKLPFGSTYSQAVQLLDLLNSKKVPVQLSLNFG